MSTDGKYRFNEHGKKRNKQVVVLLAVAFAVMGLLVGLALVLF